MRLPTDDEQLAKMRVAIRALEAQVRSLTRQRDGLLARCRAAELERNDLRRLLARKPAISGRS